MRYAVPEVVIQAQTMSAQEKPARSEAKSILLKVGLHQSLFVMALSTGLEIGFGPHDAQGLEGARPGKLAVIEISPSGLGLHFPQ